jgi:hypothetical protein
MLPTNPEQRVEVSGVTVEMDGQNGFGAWRDGICNPVWVEAEGRIVNVHIDGLCADIGDRPTRRDKSAGGGDDLIAGADVEQLHRHVQCGGAAVKPDAVFSAAESCELLLELRDVRAEAKGALVQSAGDGSVNVSAYSLHLGGQIEVGDWRGRVSLKCHAAGRIRGDGSGNKRRISAQSGLSFSHSCIRVCHLPQSSP